MIINKKTEKKRRAMSKWLVSFIIASIFIFTGVAIYVQLRTSIELSATLITCFYGFCTGELWMLAGIKKTKVKNDYNSNNNDNEGEG